MRVADHDGQLRLIVEVGDDVAVAVDVAAGGDGLVHALGKIDRERVRRFRCLAGDALALLGVVKIIEPRQITSCSGRGIGASRRTCSSGSAALRSTAAVSSAGQRPMSACMSAQPGTGCTAGRVRVEQTDGAAAVDFKCHELHRAALPPCFAPGSECIRRK